MASRGFDQRDAPFIFRRADFARHGVADFFKAGKIPEVRKLAALLRFHGLNGAILTFQKNARAIGLLTEREAAAVGAQLGKLLDEVVLAQALERREPRDLGVVQQHLARPAAAGRAAFTF